MWSSKAAIRLKERIRNKQLSLGFQQFIASPNITEIAGIAGFDWLWFCTEHGSSDYGPGLESCIRAAENVGMVPFVRVTEPRAHFIYMKALEYGAKGVIVPRIRTREDLEFAVKAVKWPGGPYHGNHGRCSSARRWKYGDYEATDPYDYVNHDEAETFVIPLLETIECMENLDDILSVKGIDFAVFGPGDLGMTLGVRGRGRETQEKGLKLIEEWRKKAMEACARHNVPFCQEFDDVESAKRLIEEGLYVLSSNVDAGLLRIFLKNTVTKIKAITSS